MENVLTETLPTKIYIKVQVTNLRTLGKYFNKIPTLKVPPINAKFEESNWNEKFYDEVGTWLPEVLAAKREGNNANERWSKSLKL